MQTKNLIEFLHKDTGIIIVIDQLKFTSASDQVEYIIRTNSISAVKVWHTFDTEDCIMPHVIENICSYAQSINKSDNCSHMIHHAA